MTTDVLRPPARHRAQAAIRLSASAVALSAAAGVLLVAAADTAGRLGYASSPWADRLYWLGQAFIVVPPWVRLLSRDLPGAVGTVSSLMIFTVAEYLVKVCYSPAAFTYPDELAHWLGTVNIMETGRLFTVNYLLPIGPHFPGLEEITAGLASITGLPVFTAGLIVAGVAHLLFVCLLYMLFRKVSSTDRIAGIAVFLYATNPLFQSFDSMFLYQTAALLFFGITLLAAWQLAAGGSRGNKAGWLTVAVICTFATVVTHHVTSYVLVATLALVAVAAQYTGDRRTRNWTALLALLSAIAVACWLVFAAPQTSGYLQPAVDGLVENFKTFFTSGQSSAQPLSSGPLGNKMLGMAGVLALSALLPLGWRRAWRVYRHQPWVMAMVTGSVSWYVIVAVRLAAADGSELAGRAATFVLAPAGFVAALVMAYPQGDALRRSAAGAAGLWRVPFLGATLLMAGLLQMFGSLANGWPPYWERLPGPHQVAGAERSVGPEEIAAVRWALTDLGPGNRFASDVGSYSILGSYGDQDPVRDIAYLFTSRMLTWPEVRLAELQAVQYALVDRRLATELPASGAYFPVDPDAGRYSHPLPEADLTKFDHLAGATRLYDSGNIVIYGLGGVGYGR